MYQMTSISKTTPLVEGIKSDGIITRTIGVVLLEYRK